MNVPKGVESDFLETKIFGPIEGEAKPILDRWQLPGARLEAAEVPKMAVFLAFMFTRNPRSVQVVKEVNEAGLEQIQKDLVENPARQRELYERCRNSGQVEGLPPYEEMEEYLNNREKYFRTEMNRKAALLSSIELTDLVCQKLLELNWCLCTAPSGTLFITSDSPLSVFCPTDRKHAIFGGGLGQPQVEVSFPISPTTYLLLNRRSGQRYRRISEKVANELNKRTAWMAERFIISTIKANAIEKLVRESSATRLIPKMDRAVIASRFKGLALKDQDKDTVTL